MVNRQRIKHVINDCDFLNVETRMTQREVTKNLKEFTKYMDRFENYVGVALNEPEYTYDREFNADIEKRYQSVKSVSR
jgi:hypothetical protein